MQGATTQTPAGSFDDIVLPHLDAASRLARWLLRNDDAAEDVVQEAALRALRYFRTFTGGNARAWFLRIVRNTCCGWSKRAVHAPAELFDEELHSHGRSESDPETLALRTEDVDLIDDALQRLPDRFRQLLVLRELEGLSYREVAAELDVPIGTVMSGLSRARQALRAVIACQKLWKHEGHEIVHSHVFNSTAHAAGGRGGFSARRRSLHKSQNNADFQIGRHGAIGLRGPSCSSC